MKKINLISKSGEPYSVQLPEPTPGYRSGYVFAFAKSGSTLLDNILTTYCQQMGISTFSLFGQAFDQGLNTRGIDSDAIGCFFDEGYIYTGFRHYPDFDLDLAAKKTILLTRDPRDMLVSLYYSIAQSHVIPWKNANLKKQREHVASMGIDQYVLNTASVYNRQLAEYLEGLGGSNLAVYRYEDVIYKKQDWIKHVLEHLEVEVRKSLVKRVVAEFDEAPETESPEKHIRQVHPGDHRRKLRPESIERLNEVLSPFLKEFNYDY